MRRRLFTFASAVSLLLFVAILPLLLVGSRIQIVRSWTLAIDHQWISISNTATPFHVIPLFGGGTAMQARRVVQMNVPGFRFTRFTWPPQCPLGTWWSCGVAPIVPLLLSGPLPTMWLIRRSWRSAQNPTCKRCRYNLTGNTSGICPECGTAVAGKAGA